PLARAARGGGEPIAGLSRPRNAGARVAANDLLVYLDDDARPAPGRIESLRDAFFDPRVAIAGGPLDTPAAARARRRPDLPARAAGAPGRLAGRGAGVVLRRTVPGRRRFRVPRPRRGV